MRIGLTAVGDGERSRFFLVDFDRERLRCCETFFAALSFDFAIFNREKFDEKKARKASQIF